MTKTTRSNKTTKRSTTSASRRKHTRHGAAMEAGAAGKTRPESPRQHRRALQPPRDPGTYRDPAELADLRPAGRSSPAAARARRADQSGGWNTVWGVSAQMAETWVDVTTDMMKATAGLFWPASGRR